MVKGKEVARGSLEEVSEKGGIKESTAYQYFKESHRKEYLRGERPSAVFRTEKGDIEARKKKAREVNKYRLYYGDEYVDEGSAPELAEKLGLSVFTIYKYATDAHKADNAGRKDIYFADNLGRARKVAMSDCYECNMRVNKVHEGYFCPVCLTQYNEYAEIIDPIY